MFRIVLFLTTVSLSCIGKPESSFLALQKSLGNFQQIEGEFDQAKYIKELDIQLKSSGKFKITKDLLIWEQIKPSYNKLEISKEGVQIDGTKIPNAPQNIIFSEIFNCLLFLEKKCLDAHFTLQQKKDLGSNHWSIELVPKSDLLKKGIEKLHLDGDQSRIFKVDIFEHNKNKNVLRFNNTKRN